MNKSFNNFAKYYDLIYKSKDYEKEVDFLENIFESIHYEPQKILEVGCGTGNYTRILLERGYKVIALDTSENMLKIARKKCACKFINGDIGDIAINEKFDACIAMFAVIGYITKNSDITKALNNIHRHLKPKGIFTFDVWNGLAVMRILPERRVKEIENNKVRIIRIAVPNLRPFDHVCEVDYKLLILDKRNNTFNEINEKHIVKFYFPQEIKLYLKDAGFEVLKICPFLDINGKVDENVWNICIIARATGEDR